MLCAESFSGRETLKAPKNAESKLVAKAEGTVRERIGTTFPYGSILGGPWCLMGKALFWVCPTGGSRIRVLLPAHKPHDTIKPN